MSTSTSTFDRRVARPARFALAHSGDWRTLLVASIVYVSWVTVVFSHRLVPWPATVLLLGWFGAWHLSLVHELVHGHPFKDRRLNELLGGLPLTVWVPFRSFRILHLKHHRSALTDPVDDPESYYVLPDVWASSGRVRRWLWWANRTLAYRLTVGAVFDTVRFVGADVFRAVRGVPGFRAAWLGHVVGLVPVFALIRFSGLPVWQFVLGGVLLSRSVNMVRSFPEHRFADDPDGRTAQVKAGRLMGLLMLNNNLHVAHHDAPHLPWFRVPAHSELIDADAVAARGAGLYVGGYREVFSRFLFRPFDRPTFPS